MRVKLNGSWQIVESWGKDQVLLNDGKKIAMSEIQETLSEKEYAKRFVMPKNVQTQNNSQGFHVVVTDLSQPSAILKPVEIK